MRFDHALEKRNINACYYYYYYYYAMYTVLNNTYTVAACGILLK